MSDRENPEKGDEEAKETDTRTEPASMEETEGRDPDSGPSESNVRTDLRHEIYPRSGAEKRERQAHDLEEHKQKKRRVENLRIDPNAQSGEGGSQTEQRLEIPENFNVNAQEQADMERQNREAQEKAQEERRRQIDNERRQARLRLERIPENFNVNAQEQADMERQNREAQEKAQEERRRQIDNERRQARLRLERMQPRVLTNNVDQLREALPDIGIERKEGDGF
ncbi:hypothetical protein F2Q69_00053866 [Brassica cretica]|uniref:Uncharacterized protein n=1 Tax=Brassica cretica TaxID=69181 RepID=A0A8S9MWN3_BRACR|nr:hypothetical protein F2Q69_00053866 [Brassica cretica]